MTSMRPCDGFRAPCGRTIWSRLWLLFPRKRPSPLPPAVPVLAPDPGGAPKMLNDPDVAGVPEAEDELDRARERE